MSYQFIYKSLDISKVDLNLKIKKFSQCRSVLKTCEKFHVIQPRNKQFHDQFFTYEHTKPHFFLSSLFFAHVHLFFMLHF